MKLGQFYFQFFNCYYSYYIKYEFFVVKKKMDTSSKNNNHNLNHAIAGAVSGFVTRFACQPLDVVKIRFQVKEFISCGMQ